MSLATSVAKTSVVRAAANATASDGGQAKEGSDDDQGGGKKDRAVTQIADVIHLRSFTARSTPNCSD